MKLISKTDQNIITAHAQSIHVRIEFTQRNTLNVRIATAFNKIPIVNKFVFCMGDQFDVNLSNYNIHTPTNDIDNIFSNNTVHKAIIGIIIP